MFILLDKTGLHELINNAICWIACVLFQFATNRIWVFDAKTHTVLQFVKQLLSFFAGRVFTLVIEEIILFVFIEICEFNTLAVKIIGQIVVIVANYVISKLFIFKKKSDSKTESNI
jgi:putative flippase GtrA